MAAVVVQRFDGSIDTRERSGEFTGASRVILVFCAVLMAVAMVTGGIFLAAGLSWLLVFGSALVAMGGETLTVRQAIHLGVVHVMAFVLLSI